MRQLTLNKRLKNLIYHSDNRFLTERKSNSVLKNIRYAILKIAPPTHPEYGSGNICFSGMMNKVNTNGVRMAINLGSSVLFKRMQTAKVIQPIAKTPIAAPQAILSIFIKPLPFSRR